MRDGTVNASVSNQNYTVAALRAVSLAELFEARFEHGLAGPVRFRVELSAPDGPSTVGGKQALQHIKLIPEGGGLAVLIGSANTTGMVAEIRTYEHIAALYAKRFRGAKLPVDVTHYYELGQGLAAFFRAQQMQVKFAELDGSASADAVRDGTGRAWMVLVGVAAGLIILAVAYALVFLRR
jgi:hypothetical protein